MTAGPPTTDAGPPEGGHYDEQARLKAGTTKRVVLAGCQWEAGTESAEC